MFLAVPGLFLINFHILLAYLDFDQLVIILQVPLGLSCDLTPLVSSLRVLASAAEHVPEGERVLLLVLLLIFHKVLLVLQLLFLKLPLLTRVHPPPLLLIWPPPLRVIVGLRVVRVPRLLLRLLIVGRPPRLLLTVGGLLPRSLLLTVVGLLPRSLLLTIVWLLPRPLLLLLPPTSLPLSILLGILPGILRGLLLILVNIFLLLSLVFQELLLFTCITTPPVLPGWLPLLLVVVWISVVGLLPLLIVVLRPVRLPLSLIALISLSWRKTRKNDEWIYQVTLDMLPQSYPQVKIVRAT